MPAARRSAILAGSLRIAVPSRAQRASLALSSLRSWADNHERDARRGCGAAIVYDVKRSGATAQDAAGVVQWRSGGARAARAAQSSARTPEKTRNLDANGHRAIHAVEVAGGEVAILVDAEDEVEPGQSGLPARRRRLSVLNRRSNVTMPVVAA